MRPVFADGFNSVAHLAIGVLSTQYWVIIPLFVAYQYLGRPQNRIVDLAEFGIGWALAAAALNRDLLQDG